MNAALFPDLVVNGETVPHAVVAAEAQNHDAPTGKPGIAWRKAANAVAVRTLLLQEARKRQIMADPAEVAPGRFETEEEALIRGLLETEVEVAAPSEDAVHAEWSRDPSRFRAPPLWEVSHILIACDPRDKDETTAAKARADHVLDAVTANPAQVRPHRRRAQRLRLEILTRGAGPAWAGRHSPRVRKGTAWIGQRCRYD